MKKFIFILTALFFFSSVQPASASYLYTFSSGDVLDPNANATYGFGRIDFDSDGIPYISTSPRHSNMAAQQLTALRINHSTILQSAYQSRSTSRNALSASRKIP